MHGRQGVQGPHRSPLLSPKLSGEFRVTTSWSATIAFLDSDRPEGPGADEPYGDEGVAKRVGQQTTGRPRFQSRERDGPPLTCGRASWTQRVASPLRAETETFA